MPDYNQGKIYKLIVDNYDKIYIGSTCETLSRRLGCHMSEYKKILKTNNTYKKPKSYELFYKGQVSIILLEDCKCDRKEQLLARERYYIEQNRDICLNMTTPGITNKECHKRYYQNNKEILSEKQKIYYETHKEQHSAKGKEYRELHKEEIKAKNAIKFNCECGGVYNDKHKSRHMKTKLHLEYIKTI
jgi:hypothetical protein